MLETLIDNVKLKFFLPFCFVELLRIYLHSFFDNILAQFVKKRPSAPWFVFEGL